MTPRTLYSLRFFALFGEIDDAGRDIWTWDLLLVCRERARLGSALELALASSQDLPPS